MGRKREPPQRLEFMPVDHRELPEQPGPAGCIERWPKPEHVLLAGLLEGALHRATGRVVRCVLMSGGVQSRFLVTGEAAAGKAREWLDGGVSWGEVLARLHAPAGGAT